MTPSQPYQSLWPWRMPTPIRMPSNRGSDAQMHRIAQDVAHAHGLRLSDLTGREHAAAYSRPRHEAMWEIRRRTDLSSIRIGRFFNRDHATVLAGCKAHERRQREALLGA